MLNKKKIWKSHTIVENRRSEFYPLPDGNIISVECTGLGDVKNKDISNGLDLDEKFCRNSFNLYSPDDSFKSEKVNLLCCGHLYSTLLQDRFILFYNESGYWDSTRPHLMDCNFAVFDVEPFKIIYENYRSKSVRYIDISKNGHYIALHHVKKTGKLSYYKTKIEIIDAKTNQVIETLNPKDYDLDNQQEFLADCDDLEIDVLRTNHRYARPNHYDLPSGDAIDIESYKYTTTLCHINRDNQVHTPDAPDTPNTNLEEDTNNNEFKELDDTSSKDNKCTVM